MTYYDHHDISLESAIKRIQATRAEGGGIVFSTYIISRYDLAGVTSDRQINDVEIFKNNNSYYARLPRLTLPTPESHFVVRKLEDLSGYDMYEITPGPKYNEKTDGLLLDTRPLIPAKVEANVDTGFVKLVAGEYVAEFREVEIDLYHSNLSRALMAEIAEYDFIPIIHDVVYVGNTNKRPITFRVDKAANANASVNVTGYALDVGNNLIYLGVSGGRQSTDSIRATLSQGKDLNLMKKEGGTYQVHPISNKYKYIAKSIPGYSFTAVGFLAREASTWEPGDLFSYLLFFKEMSPEEMRLEWLKKFKKAIEIPLLNEWALPLFEAGKNAKLINSLKVGGHCKIGIETSVSSEKWRGITTTLLRNHKMAIN